MSIKTANDMQHVPEKTGWNSLPGELRNKIYHYVLDSTRGFDKVPADGVIDLRYMRDLPWHALRINKQLRQEMSAILYTGSNGRFRLSAHGWKHHLGRYFDFSQVKDLEIVWEPMATPVAWPLRVGEIRRKYRLPHIHEMNQLRQLTMRLSKVKDFRRLAVEHPAAGCIPGSVLSTLR